MFIEQDVDFSTAVLNWWQTSSNAKSKLLSYEIMTKPSEEMS